MAGTAYTRMYLGGSHTYSTHKSLLLLRTPSVQMPSVLSYGVLRCTASLFTNLPVQETVYIILNSVAQNPLLRPLPISYLRHLLKICTTNLWAVLSDVFLPTSSWTH